MWGGTQCGRLRGAEGTGGNNCSEAGGEEDLVKSARKGMGWEKAETLMNKPGPWMVLGTDGCREVGVGEGREEE